ncbi:MAG: hypothetical protein IPQ08_12730 [Chitinophagaceae bacterium]|nr:hypothetical protein [Chitinophagaceae bacterium]
MLCIQKGWGCLTDPKFISEHALVMVARLKDGKTCLVLAHPTEGSIIRLTDPSFGVIGYPCVYENLVFFTASWSGNDEIYSFDLLSKKILRYTNSNLGNYFVNVADGKLIWSKFTAEGYLLRRPAGCH